MGHTQDEIFTGHTLDEKSQIYVEKNCFLSPVIFDDDIYLAVAHRLFHRNTLCDVNFYRKKKMVIIVTLKEYKPILGSIHQKKKNISKIGGYFFR